MSRTTSSSRPLPADNTANQTRNHLRTRDKSVAVKEVCVNHNTIAVLWSQNAFNAFTIHACFPALKSRAGMRRSKRFVPADFFICSNALPVSSKRN